MKVVRRLLDRGEAEVEGGYCRVKYGPDEKMMVSSA